MEKQLEIGDILHCSVIVKDTAAALVFYRDVLGLSVDNTRPDLGYPGAWLKVGKGQIHLLELPNPDSLAIRPVHGGRDRHTAFAINDIELLRERLESANVEYTLSKSGRKALFTRDPDGNALEFVQN